MNRSVVMLEFNELSPVLMADFIAKGWLPEFARLRGRSSTYITEAGETGAALNPWVQWVTVHSGLTAAEHGIEQLGEAGRLTSPTIADAVTAAGRAAWLCGPMNVQPVTPIAGFLPDPWSVDATPRPAELTPFFRFVSANVQEHTNEAAPLSQRDLFDVVRFLSTHGLSPATAASVVGQLVGERVGRRERWRRAEVLDRLQWDVFRHYHARLRPDLATFFSNSTAHFQHLRWDEMEDDRERSAVVHGYRQMDRLVGKALALAGANGIVVLCTALSQTANRDADRSREGFYRPRDLDALVAALGLTGVSATAPVMAEQWHVFFVDDAAARAGARVLDAAQSDGDPVFDVHVDGSQVFVGCRFFNRRDLPAPLDRLLYWADAPREGTHHPDGILWIGNGTGRADDERVPLTAVAPTILSLLDVSPPPSMHGPVLAAAGLRS